MTTPKEHIHSSVGLDVYGLGEVKQVHWNLSPAELYEHALRNREGRLTNKGALCVLTGQYTGRSPKDKFIVDLPSIHDDIWWGSINQPVSQTIFDRLYNKAIQYLKTKGLYVIDAFAGADPKYRMPVRVVSEAAYHGLFAWNMFVRPTLEERANHVPEFTVIAAPNLGADPETDGTRSPTFIGVNFEKKIILILGTLYSGEVKKGIFGVMNYRLPKMGVLPMHCSANIGPEGTAIFFGLSGTGKTTLSSDASRTLIGDDEHGWSDDGIFNMEGGCYAKTINLDPEKEPEIYAATQRFGAILENVPLDFETRQPDFDDDVFTTNTRCSYPLDFIPNASETGLGDHPKNIIFLTADAFGVLPPVARLTPEQAMYHFISGYTAKVAGTERGVTEPQATFSACFGAPFMPLHPTVYADMLAEKIRKHGSQVWLINTGWTGGPYGVGQRMSLPITRRIVNAALAGELNDVEYFTEPFFGLAIPTHIEGVPDEILNPRNTWANPDDYDQKAAQLAEMFRRNFKQFEDRASEAVLSAAPQA
ncbi:MAG: phosphoenolpyruvate carboxykinase (ATP) [Phototrophicales bacterium]|nr:MAG: phosphoenolpyruvate carboxykinase (ATP) [Phototrophicales bacterium]